MIRPAENTLLIADPFLQDENFIRAVIYMCSHDQEGSMGFKLNEFSGYKINQLIKGLDSCSLPVFLGGPVSTNTIHFLHMQPDCIPDGQAIGDSIYWGGDFSIVKKALMNRTLNPNKIRFFLGYSGWGKGQLEQELSEKTWLVASPNQQVVFSTQPENVWRDSVRLLGPDFLPLLHYPIDPQLN